MTPGTEFARDFCAGIGPLQLGVVLIFCIIFSHCVMFLRGGIYFKCQSILKEHNTYESIGDY